MSKLIDTLDKHLVEDWRQVAKFASMWLMSANGAVVAAWISFPNEIREILPPWGVKALLAFLVISSMLARLWKQKAMENRDGLHTQLDESHPGDDAARIAADHG